MKAEFTAREKEVAEFLKVGLSNKVIARRLGLSPLTVKAHVSRVLKKTSTATRTQAAIALNGGTVE